MLWGKKSFHLLEPQSAGKHKGLQLKSQPIFNVFNKRSYYDNKALIYSAYTLK